MERVFQISAAVLIGVAAFFVWQGSTDAVFIAAVAGAVCFFFERSVRDWKARQTKKSGGRRRVRNP